MAAPSFWLEEALKAEHAEPCPPLEGDAKADICIVGGGYTGLWTAIRLKELEPSLDVLLIEAKYCGYGASGRNAGFLLNWSSKFTLLQALAGTQEAVRLHRLATTAVESIIAFCRSENIDCRLRQDGWLWTAMNEAQIGAWRPTVDALDAAGEHPYVELPAKDAQARSGSPLVRGAIFEAGMASLQPAMLVRGLRRAALARGVRIHEGTSMRGLARASPPGVRTDRGYIAAKKVVLALNAWAATLPEFSRSVLVVASDQLITEPVPERLKALGLDNGTAISDSRLLVFGYRSTPDGRMNFSKGGGDFVFGGRIGTQFDAPARRGWEVTELFHRVFPKLADVPVASSWRGPVTRTPHGLAFFGNLKRSPDIVFGHGYCGNGVGPSWIGGRICASLALERKDEWSSMPLVGDAPGRFPPEPFRFPGSYLVRGAIVRKERAEDEGRTPHPIDRTLTKLAPAGLTPTKD